MIHTRFRLDLMVCSLSRKNHAEMKKKMTTPTLPPPAMTSWKKIRSGPRGEFQHVIAVMDDEVMGEDHEHRDDAQRFNAGTPHLNFWSVPVRCA